jgi:hypothetical protein
MRIREGARSHFVHLDEPTNTDVKLELIGGLSCPEDELGDEQVADMVRREISRIPPLLRRRARTELRERVARHCGLRGCASLTQRSQYGQVAFCRAS